MEPYLRRSHARVGWWLIPVVFLIGGALGYLALSFFGVPLFNNSQTAREPAEIQKPPGDLAGGSDQDPGGSALQLVSDRSNGGGSKLAARDVSDGLWKGRETALVWAARVAGPSVVSITVTQTRLVRYRPPGASPFDALFPGWVPGRIYREEIPGLGSGVIINSEGLILTNAHVVNDANQIKVTLTDGRTYDGTLIGSDTNHDLAVVRIEGEDLPAARIGDSDSLLVGEWVMAIGNPFAFLLNDHQPTVTAGVISATHRDIRPSEDNTAIYKDMVQTDAAVNPGNSGGPLVNSLGEIVGINTFIFSKGGGSEGIGFAIPINNCLEIANEIVQYGRVRQPWLGVTLRPISPYLAAYFQIRDRRGLLVWALEGG
ncbi:MAG: trypsin-like peptidase domain-containing protein, partial [Candidatus Eisenbacteria bacterium]|nr:trypsin-like peptidase domain-containing protein [Candidatus Eisenbacteria bacterium]